jgi:hypothetical protein
VIGISVTATTMGGILLTVDWRHVGWISIQIGSAYSEIFAVRVDPGPQFFICIPSLGISLTVRTHKIDGKPVAITAAQASSMVGSVCRSL